MTQANNN